jgi:hypothetical protein
MLIAMVQEIRWIISARQAIRPKINLTKMQLQKLALQRAV